jgi:predicted Zn-dependent protease
MEADKIYAITPSYKNLNQYVALAKEGVKKLEQLEKERRDKEKERRRKIKVASLLGKAEKAIDNKKMDLATGFLDEVISLDPNNDAVLRLRREIKLYKKEQDRIAIEKAQKEAERKRQLSELSPGKTYFLKREWFKAISKLSDFLRSKSIDEDLRKEASDMLNKSKKNLKAKVSPLLGKARSLKEGQDLKGAYEVYNDILIIEPSHEEALNEMNEIRETLEIRSKKIYREAIISESLSLYSDAKAKFQEVQQVSPVDSEYYKKAVEKLKEYLD